MKCRLGCAGCCTVISISSPLPGMPNGKPAGVPCVNLDEQNLCTIHGLDIYPSICGAFTPDEEICGTTNEEAYANIAKWERLTSNVGDREKF